MCACMVNGNDGEKHKNKKELQQRKGNRRRRKECWGGFVIRGPEQRGGGREEQNLPSIPPSPVPPAKKVNPIPKRTAANSGSGINRC